MWNWNKGLSLKSFILCKKRSAVIQSAKQSAEWKTTRLQMSRVFIRNYDGWYHFPGESLVWIIVIIVQGRSVWEVTTKGKNRKVTMRQRKKHLEHSKFIEEICILINFYGHTYTILHYSLFGRKCLINRKAKIKACVFWTSFQHDVVFKQHLFMLAHWYWFTDAFYSQLSIVDL